VRDSRAAIQRTIPGKPGQLLGIGVALVFRFLPVLQGDLRTIREAMAARLGTERSAVDRASTIGILGLTRAFDRADRLSLALQARCFAWNPTLPPLSFSYIDYPVLVIAVALSLSAFVCSVGFERYVRQRRRIRRERAVRTGRSSRPGIENSSENASSSSTAFRRGSSR